MPQSVCRPEPKQTPAWFPILSLLPCLNSSTMNVASSARVPLSECTKCTGGCLCVEGWGATGAQPCPFQRSTLLGSLGCFPAVCRGLQVAVLSSYPRDAACHSVVAPVHHLLEATGSADGFHLPTLAPSPCLTWLETLRVAPCIYVLVAAGPWAVLRAVL